MAHSEVNKIGQKLTTLPVNCPIGIIIDGKLHKTYVSMVDGGGWIYPCTISDVQVPQWLKSSQVIDLRGFDV